jgi:hypothetical protein
MRAAPTRNRRPLPYHSEIEMLELEARRGIHAGMLPSNQNGDAMDGVTGGRISAEAQERGWTSQQPWSHVDCPVMHICVLCGKTVDPDYLRDHAQTKCRVRRELEQ